MISDSYDICEAAIYADFKTPWMVDYLCRSGIIKPSKRPNPGRGGRRLFSFSDIVVLRAINELLKKGISVKRLALEIRRYRKQFALITAEAMPFHYLATDGKRLFLDDKAEGLRRLASPGQYCFRFLVDMEHAHRQVKELVDSGPAIPTVASFRRSRSAQ